MPVIFASIIGAVGNFFGGLFNFKGQQAETVQEAIKTLQSINATDAQSTTAAAQVLSSVLTQGSFLEKNWRPVFMVVCMTIIICSFFGYVPSHFNDPLTPMMEKLWTCLEMGLGIYLPARTLEKIVTQFNIGSILKTLIQKKVS